MQLNSQPIRDAQRAAFHSIKSPFVVDADGKPVLMHKESKKIISATHPAVMQHGGPAAIENGTHPMVEKIPNHFYADPNTITAPACIIQELKYVNTQNIYTFDFSMNAPQPSAQFGNVLLKKNNVAAIYAVQLYIGTGDTAVNRVYRSYGATANDEAIYNSIFSMQIETDTLINYWPGISFKDVGITNTYFEISMGMQPANPIRMVTGELGVFNVNVSMINPFGGIPLSGADLYLSMRLWNVAGQATSGRK